MKKLLFIILLVNFICLNSKSQGLYESDFEWKIPGGEYVNPVSFFSMHGYVNAVFASSSEEWKSGNFNGIGMPGQLIVPNSNNSSFTNDEALWISSELNQQSSLVMEMHLVTDPSGSGAAGPGALTLALTEANVKINIYKNWIRLALGTFWSPFGIQNRDWLGAQNLFSTIPLASGAYLTHYNERGVRIDGFYEKNKFGFNYVFSVGNGFNAYDIRGWMGYDLNDNKALNGRVSLFPGFGQNLNIGISGSYAILNDGNNQLPATSKMEFKHSITAFGTDMTIKLKKLTSRSYLIYSEENLENTIEKYTLPNIGIMSELFYEIELNKLDKIESIVPKIRIDYLSKSQEIFEVSDTYTNFSFGTNVKVNDSYSLSIDYNIFNEKNFSINNNRLILRASANF